MRFTATHLHLTRYTRLVAMIALSLLGIGQALAAPGENGKLELPSSPAAASGASRQISTRYQE